MSVNQVVILSLGARVQSTALALLLDAGLLEGYARPDCAIFADTQAEPSWVYQTVAALEERLSYQVIRASYSDIEQDTWLTLNREPVRRRPAQDGYIFFDIPTFIGTQKPPKPTMRRCTEIYKIDVIKRAVRRAYGWPIKVQQYMGISLDEAIRMRDSRVQYITNVYPLVERGWTRAACGEWLSEHYPEIPVGRSSCYFCPFHDVAEWLNIADNAPDLFQKACDLDARLSQLEPPQWLTNKGPLRDLVLAARSQDAPGPDHIAGDECTGNCFT